MALACRSHYPLYIRPRPKAQRRRANRQRLLLSAILRLHPHALDSFFFKRLKNSRPVQICAIGVREKEPWSKRGSKSRAIDYAILRFFKPAALRSRPNGTPTPRESRISELRGYFFWLVRKNGYRSRANRIYRIDRARIKRRQGLEHSRRQAEGNAIRPTLLLLSIVAHLMQKLYRKDD